MNATATFEIDGDDASRWRNRELRGKVRWHGETPARPVSLHVFWMTRGRGTEEISVTGEHEFRPVRGATESFHFKLPDSPVSFNGKLVSVAWMLEIVVGDEAVATHEFVHAPDGVVRELGEVAKPRSKCRLWVSAG